jgi:uncharacterized protein YlxW (UPF0749 family)
MNKRGPQLVLTGLCFLLGILLVSQFRVQEKITAEVRAQSPQNQLTLLGNLVESNGRLREEVSKLEAQVRPRESLEAASPETVREEVERLRLVNGLAEASGPGVRVALAANLDVYWLQDLLNELRNAGAVAVAINGHRIMATSVISGTARQIELDGTLLTGDYIVEAVGDQESLAVALSRPGGVLLQLKAQHGAGAATLSRPPSLRLAAREEAPAFRLARPVP